VRERILNIALNDEITSRNGKKLKLRLDTLCVHGDEPTGVIVARAARAALESAGVRVVPLPEMALGR
jgi:5-oxoprolinase (ATP-hydrolysing) subunit A